MKIHFIESHSYGLFYGLLNVLGCLLLFLINLLLYFVLFREIQAAVSGQLEDPMGLVVDLGAILVFGLVLLGLLNYTPNIRVYEEGLKVQIFLFWWAFVPWDDILYLGLRSNPMGQSRVVVVRALTPAHVVIGWIYAFRLKPGFLILSKIDRYHELMYIIKSRTGLD
jgi:hypothetical protein